MPYVRVAIGGALGSVARYGCSGFVGRLAGGAFPVMLCLVAVMIGYIAGMKVTRGGA